MGKKRHSYPDGIEGVLEEESSNESRLKSFQKKRDFDNDNTLKKRDFRRKVSMFET